MIFVYDSSGISLKLRSFCTSYVNEISGFKYGQHMDFIVPLNYEGSLGVTGHKFTENGFELVANLSTYEINKGVFWIAYE